MGSENSKHEVGQQLRDFVDSVSYNEEPPKPFTPDSEFDPDDEPLTNPIPKPAS